jgi:hypothetical protein
LTRERDQAASYYNSKFLGENLIEVSEEVIKTERQDIKARWFHGDLDIDLFLWSDEQKNLIKQQFCLCGQVVEWNLVEGVKTGYTEVIESQGAKTLDASETVKMDTCVNKAAVQQAVEIIGYVPGLNDIEKQSICKNYRENPRIDSMDPRDFVDFYGYAHEKSASNGIGARLSRFGAILRRWFFWLTSSN